MVVPVLSSTKRDGELFADLAPHRPGVGEPQMVGVNGASAAFAYHFRLHVAAMLQFGPARLISLKRKERIFGDKPG